MTEWLLLAIAAVAVFLIWKVIKKTVSLLFTIGAVLGVVLLILGFFAVQDAQDFKENFGNSKSVFVQADNSTYLSAIILDLNSTETTAGFDTYDNLSQIPELLEKDEMPEEYYKLFILEKDAFQNSTIENISIGPGDLNKTEIITAMYSEDPRESVSTALARDTEASKDFIRDALDRLFQDEQELRRYIFANALMNIFGGSPLEVIEGVKDENILIHPKPLMFKTIELIPFGMFETVDEVAEENKTEG